MKLNHQCDVGNEAEEGGYIMRAKSHEWGLFYVYHIHTYVYICIFLCVCVCMCLWCTNVYSGEKGALGVQLYSLP